MNQPTTYIAIAQEDWQMLMHRLDELESAILSGKDCGNKVFSVSEAMDYLRCSRATIDRYRNDGLIAYTKTGGKVFFQKSDLDKFLNRYKRTSR